VLCENRRVTDLARLSLVPQCGRGHGGLYDGLTAGRVEIGRLRRAAGTPAGAGKYGQPGPGRPAGSRNKRKAPRRHAGKTILRQHSIDDKKRKQAKPARRTNEPAG